MISVIVPIFNVEKYLNRCVESILKQSYTDFELILVDDGSPDKCPAICDEYALQDKRIKVIHKQNGGLSSARNAGLEIAKGDYIAFVDSDDFIHPDYLRLLYQALKETGADISICDYKTIKDYKIIEEQNENIDKLEIYDNYSIFLLRSLDIFVSWNKLYKKSLFKSIRFQEGKINEDIGVYYRLLYLSKKTVAIYNKLYYYFYNESGIMNSPFSEKKFASISFFIESLSFFNKIAKSDKRYYAVIKRIVHIIIDAYYEMNKTYVYFDFKHNKESRQIKKEIKKIIRKYKVFPLCYTNLPYYEFYFGEKNIAVKIKYFFYKVKRFIEFKVFKNKNK